MSKKIDLGIRIRTMRLSRDLTQAQLAEMIGQSPASISMYELGRREPDIETMEALADTFNVPLSSLVGKDDEPDNLFSASTMKKVPVLGEIACGIPILAEENVEGYMLVSPGIQCDFALLCKGDSMQPSFFDGDFVLIRQQEDVNDGQIAAVFIDGEATLKRIHHIPGGVILLPDNQEKYKATSYIGEDAANIRILGRAVGYQRALK